MDVVAAAAALTILAPLFLAVAVLVACTDGRPVLYRRRVLGQQGSFNALKFRTMARNAGERMAQDPALRRQFEQSYKLRDDPRVTPLGRWLRRYSLDELPQFWNVLRGQMSVVGPRMISPEELARYAPHQELLLSVKPGITGYWQVEGRQTRSYEERVSMDLYYIMHRSLLLDLKIIVKTPYKVLRAEGAY